MKKFEFQNNNISVEINGVKLSCDAAEGECEITAAKNDLVEFSDKIIEGKADKKEIKKHIEFTLNKIDNVFGEGSSQRIFKDRVVSLHDCTDVVSYVLACFNDFEKSKKELYDSFSGSREERRTRK